MRAGGIRRVADFRNDRDGCRCDGFVAVRIGRGEDIFVADPGNRGVVREREISRRCGGEGRLGVRGLDSFLAAVDAVFREVEGFHRGPIERDRSIRGRCRAERLRPGRGSVVRRIRAVDPQRDVLLIDDGLQHAHAAFVDEGFRMQFR